MSATQQALRAARTQFAKASGIRLSGATGRTFESIYGQTLRQFIAKGRKRSVDVWRSKAFRRWVLLEVTRIGREAKRRAKGKALTSDTLRASSLKVMRAAKAKYRVWLPQDGITLQKRGQFFEDCDLCRAFCKRR